MKNEIYKNPKTKKEDKSENKIAIKTSYIRLSQLLKLGNIVSQGSDAKRLLSEGIVKLNGEVVSERGKKVYKGDRVEIGGYGVIDVC